MKPLGPTDPQRVGQYRLLGKLGAGGMGSVYLARSDRGRTVAVKLVQPELARQPEFRRRFQQEVDAARRIGGEFTAPVLGGDTEAETPWVATGYVAGPSLHEVVTTSFGHLPERTLRILANGLVKALRDIHAAGLVHRDLKPSNVMITIDGPKVIDFGIARALEATAGEGLTRTGAAVGSPGFMSPEQCRGETVTAASDIFCLGSVLTFAATGKTPFGDANSPMTALMLAIVQGEQDLSGVPESLRGLVESCLAQDPAHRPSLDQLLRWTEAPADDNSGEPWLPGALIATLGRHAIELLDSEDPLLAPPLPSTQPPPAMPATPPPVTPLPSSAVPPPSAPNYQATQFAPSTPPPSPVPSPPPPAHSGVDYAQTMTSATPPPGYGTPPPSSYGYPPQAPQGGYGYPQGAPGTPTPGYGAPSTPHGHAVNTPYQMHSPVGPGGHGAPGNNQKKTVWIIVAAAAVAIALIVGVVVALGGGDDDKDPEANTGGTGSSGEPTEDPTQDPTEDPEPTTEADPNATVPYEMVGAWEAEFTDSEGNEIVRRMEIVEGSGGQPVATTWNLYPDVLCVGSGALLASEGTTGITITSEITRTVPSSQSCDAYGEQTLEMQGTTLLWTNADGDQAQMQMAAAGPGSDGMPYGVYGDWTATTADGVALTIDIETISAAGELAITYTDSGSGCVWEAEMVSGDINGESFIAGPGEITSGSCEPLPAYEVSYAYDDSFNETANFTRLDETTPAFTGAR